MSQRINFNYDELNVLWLLIHNKVILCQGDEEEVSSCDSCLFHRTCIYKKLLNKADKYIDKEWRKILENGFQQR